MDPAEQGELLSEMLFLQVGYESDESCLSVELPRYGAVELTDGVEHE